MSIFTLEALEAKHGDSLLLHYGAKAQPRLIVIDGGPSGTYKASLLPRLQAIRDARGEAQVEVRLMMVSHIDDDHITGVLDLSNALCKQLQAGEDLTFDILTLWHNSFDDIVAKAGENAQLPLRGASQKGGSKKSGGKAIVASVKQGRDLRLNANALSLNINSGFDDLVLFDASSQSPINIGQGLKFTVLGPRKAELDALQTKWDKEVKELLKKKVKKKPKKSGSGASLTAAELEVMAAAFLDDSIHNLSSIVVLAESSGKRMLLTGDARGDFILDSLKDASLLKNGKMHVDILKVPHHGSIRNVEDVFFQAIVADHYVFSANGKYGNPDVDTFKLIFKVRPKGPYTLWLTNPVPAALKFIKKAKPKDVDLKVRQNSERSVKIELGAAIGF